MAHEDVGVPHFPENPELFRNVIDRSRDQGFCRHTAIALAQRQLEYPARRTTRRRRRHAARRWRRAPCRKRCSAHDTGRPARVPLRVQAGSRSSLPPGVLAVDRRRCAGADPDLDRLGRAQCEARFGDSEAPGGTHRFTRQQAPDDVERFLESRRPRPDVGAHGSETGVAPAKPALHDEAASGDGSQCADLLGYQRRMPRRSRNRQPAGASPHSARSRPSIGVF